MKLFKAMIPFYVLVLVGAIGLSHWASRTVTAFVQSMPVKNRSYVVIDAGHGGIDGGATSCSGVLESKINLEIALRLNDLMHLLGHQTKMIRTEDISVYTEGKTIAQKKVSDLKNRVRIINETEGAILISVHQNYFADSRYSGAQVFCMEPETNVLAQQLQQAFANTGSQRRVKTAKGIYLMEHVDRTAVLIECGFLSNAKEEALLRSADYQKKLCAIIGSTVNRYLNT